MSIFEIMKRLVFLATFVFVVVALISSNQSAYGQNSAIYLSKVEAGYGNSTDTVATGSEIVWTMAIRNNSGGTMNAHTNGFRIYSPSGASWTLPVIDTLDIVQTTGLGWKARLEYIFPFYAVTGSISDTVALGGFQVVGVGFEDGFDAESFSITIPLPGIDSIYDGGTICVDSSAYSVNTWLWSTTVGGVIPNWSGPHCYAIAYTCCIDTRGDLNNDGKDATVLDLTYMIDSIYRGGEDASCNLEADIDSDGSSSQVSDLTYLIDFIFRGGPDLLSCH